MSEQELSAIAAEYFRRIEPSVEKHNPYTRWGMAAIQREAALIHNELVERYGLDSDALRQALRDYQAAPQGGQA